MRGFALRVLALSFVYFLISLSYSRVHVSPSLPLLTGQSRVVPSWPVPWPLAASSDPTYFGPPLPFPDGPRSAVSLRCSHHLYSNVWFYPYLSVVTPLDEFHAPRVAAFTLQNAFLGCELGVTHALVILVAQHRALLPTSTGLNLIDLFKIESPIDIFIVYGRK